MRARLVIVGQELLDHGLQVAGAEDQQVVKHLSTTGAEEPYPRSRQQLPSRLRCRLSSRSAWTSSALQCGRRMRMLGANAGVHVRRKCLAWQLIVNGRHLEAVLAE